MPRFTSILLLTLIALTGTSMAQLVGHASIEAPAVILENNTGSLTTINLSVYQGNGTISISGPQIVGSSTFSSAVTAAQYAAKYLLLNFSKYDFNYTIIGGGDNVSGPSGGAAMTMLAISALSGKRLLRNFSMTGTISSDGSIGPIGGVYDKASAVKADNLSFFLVPAVQNGSEENELYLLVQDTYNIPVVEVSNVSQAYNYAFGIASPKSNLVNYTFGTSINATALPTAPLSCSNNCNMAPFYSIVNFTFQFTNSSIGLLRGNPSFNNVVSQFDSNLNVYKAISAKGYLYGGANLGFQEYVDVFYFDSYRTTTSLGFHTLQSINNYCTSISVPQLTSSNYEYVIGGELRQTWGEYTMNASLTSYNSSVETTDDVLSFMKSAAESNGWCNAANLMYKISANGTGTNLVPSSALSNLAYSRISRASAYGNGMYLSTAEEAFAVNNYPLAIIDADYAFALSNSSQVSQNLGTGELINMSSSLATSSTHGAWATEFSNEALMYIALSEQTTNQSQRHNYASLAYQAALLASQLSIDMSTISSNLVPGQGVQQINGQTINAQSNYSSNQTNYLIQTTHEIFIIAVIMLVINIVLFFVVMYLLIPTSKASMMQLKGNNGRRRK